MAEGNMDLSIGSNYRGEFLPIQNAMRQILESLNRALAQINITAENVSEESSMRFCYPDRQEIVLSKN